MPFFLPAPSLWWAKDREGDGAQAEKQSHKDAESHEDAEGHNEETPRNPIIQPKSLSS